MVTLEAQMVALEWWRRDYGRVLPEANPYAWLNYQLAAQNMINRRRGESHQ